MLRALSEYTESHWPFLSEHVRRLALDLGCIVRACRPLEYKEDTCPNLNIQTTNICNANCVFCAYQYQDHFSPRRGVMGTDVFEKAVHGHKELGGRSIWIAPMVGDPLIDPTFVQRLRYVAREGFAVSFVTNGILLKRIHVEGLLRSGVRSFALSTGPFEKKIYKSIYRNSHYADLLEGVIGFLETRNRFHANVTVRIAFRSSIPKREVLVLPDFRERIWPLLTEKERNNLSVMTHGFDSWGGQIQQHDLPGIMRLALVPRVRRRPCKWTFLPMVMWDGLVRACGCRFTRKEPPDGKDELVVGDIRSFSLPEIWRGKQVRRLRRRFVEGDLPKVCENCAQYTPLYHSLRPR